MNVNIRKTHDDAVIPSYATSGAAGFDLVAVEDVYLAPGQTVKVPLGLAFEIPEGYEMQIRPRSGVTSKTKLRVKLGTVDADYRGEVSAIVDNVAPTLNDGYIIEVQTIDGSRYHEWFSEEGTYIIRKGDRIAQGVISAVSQAQFNVVDTLSDTERGTGGFGSTGTQMEVTE